MKTFSLICFVVLVTMQLAKAQTNTPLATTSAQQLHDNYIEKYKRYRTTGRALLGTGLVMIVGGGIVVAGYAGQGYNGSAPAAAESLLFIIGPAAALASIPFFVWAKQSKSKAALAIKGESLTFGNTCLSKSNYLALALKIPL